LSDESIEFIFLNGEHDWGFTSKVHSDNNCCGICRIYFFSHNFHRKKCWKAHGKCSQTIVSVTWSTVYMATTSLARNGPEIWLVQLRIGMSWTKELQYTEHTHNVSVSQSNNETKSMTQLHIAHRCNIAYANTSPDYVGMNFWFFRSICSWIKKIYNWNQLEASSSIVQIDR